MYGLGFEVVATIVGVLVSVCLAGGTTLVSLAVPVAVAYFVYRAWSRGTLVVAAPMVVTTGIAPSAKPPEPAGGFVKRCTCRFCGSPKVTPSKSAYVFCDYCGELIDFDFQAALADKRSKMPGPAYEALIRQMNPDLERARAAGDRAAYAAVQERIYDGYVTHCPAAVSPRIGDPTYRARFVKWSAQQTTATDFDPTCQATFAAQQAAVGRLTWDRSNPMRPKVRPDTFWPMIDAVLAHQASSWSALERSGLIESHPDRPNADILRRMALSMLVQGWMPVLEKATSDELLDRTGLRDDYTHVPPPDLERGTCPHCSAALAVAPGARRVVCTGCGHLAGVHGGSLSCHGCAAPVEVPDGSAIFACGHCGTELRRMVWA